MPSSFRIMGEQLARSTVKQLTSLQANASPAAMLHWQPEEEVSFRQRLCLPEGSVAREETLVKQEGSVS
ncbi:hypothetical protein BRADI_4g16843v3 [Brachypodium distachyon]|uniref:Uncharacterized protein n=1 Tax=Brachypodium distachyon TaxID=15368 RepID=A0A0Q3HIX3_BRADI|nr:hypothetical protein BRADI_4g16843v3 [Brachypodium distachyon]